MSVLFLNSEENIEVATLLPVKVRFENVNAAKSVECVVVSLHHVYTFVLNHRVQHLGLWGEHNSYHLCQPAMPNPSIPTEHVRLPMCATNDVRLLKCLSTNQYVLPIMSDILMWSIEVFVQCNIVYDP